MAARFSSNRLAASARSASVDDVVAVEGAPRFPSADPHHDALRDAEPPQVPRSRPPEIVEHQSRNSGAGAGASPRPAEVLDALPVVASENVVLRVFVRRAHRKKLVGLVRHFDAAPRIVLRGADVEPDCATWEVELSHPQVHHLAPPPREPAGGREHGAQPDASDGIVLLYDALLEINPSPIVAVNRAVAVGMAQGPAAGLDALDRAATLSDDSALAGYHLFPSVRGDLTMKMGRLSEAREEIQRAIAMTKNLREQELLANRLKQLEKAAFSV